MLPLMFVMLLTAYLGHALSVFLLMVFVLNQKPPGEYGCQAKGHYQDNNQDEEFTISHSPMGEQE